MWTLKSVIGTGCLLRLLLVCFARIQDYLCEVKFTDVDYRVFSDAAKLVSEGGSPFSRPTYRYTPFLTFLLLPTVVFPDFGKLLFNACDLVVALLVHGLVLKSGRGDGDGLMAAALWLFNPITAVVSSRGNADSLIALTVLATLLLLLNGWRLTAAVVHGLGAITLKIYPIIYIPSIFLFLCKDLREKPSGWTWRDLCGLVFNWDGFLYVLICLGSFALSTWVSYWMYGEEFLKEALLYHISRTDTRHNFSPYFYLLYLSEGEWWSGYLGFLAFLPQLTLVLVFAFRFGTVDLPRCWFLSTFAFVSFNKVITSQYFVWYLCLLPVISPQLARTLSLERILRLGGAWLGAQGLWLLFAYLFEFRGWNTLAFVWLASLAFLLVNCWIMARLSAGGEARKRKSD